MKREKKRLQLSGETTRHLAVDEFRIVIGGVEPACSAGANKGSCWPDPPPR